MTDTLSPIDRLRALIAADETLQARLVQFDMPQELGNAAADVAAAAGIAITAAELTTAAYPDLLGVDRFSPYPPGFARPPGRHWLPVELIGTVAGPAIGWRHFSDARLTHPFYEDAARWTRGKPLSNLLKVRTPLSALLEAGAAPDAASPDALIFHMSRCGSTLLSQMIAAMPGSIMVSEPPPFDTLLQLCLQPQVPQEQRVAFLRGMAAALGRDRFGDRQRFVIKLDSWHSLALPLLRAAFPDTPWVFLFRDPVEVMASQMRSRGSQTIPGQGYDLIYSIPDPLSHREEDYIAMVLARICSAAVEHADLGRGMFVDYADLPEAVETRILPHFGIAPDGEAVAAMRAASARDAKRPYQEFAADGDEKRREASDRVHQAVDTHLADLHRQLSSLAARR